MTEDKIIVVTDNVFGFFAAKELKENGAEVEVIEFPSLLKLDPLDPVMVYRGNGECFEKARLIYGEEIARTFWKISKENLSLLKGLKAELPSASISVKWYGTGEGETPFLMASEQASEGNWFEATEGIVDGFLVEPARLFSIKRWLGILKKKLASDGVSIRQASKAPALVSRGMDSSLEWDGSKEGAALVLWVSETPPEHPFFHEKVIPATLQGFGFAAPLRGGVDGGLFHNGVDFAMRDSEALWLGSYRNLYQDKGVGAVEAVDPVSLAGIRQFFSMMGWIEKGEKPFIAGKICAVTCDGLPLVGNLPDSQGVFYAGGFAGRGGNLLFSVVRSLVKGILEKGPFEELKLFSTRRFC